MPPAAPPPTIGVDTGGTFTDLVHLRGRETEVAKLPSTPDDPTRAVTEGVERLGGATRGTHVVHGTTVALNALLQGRLARTALVTNTGFLDLIEIGRQDRPEIYALHPRKPPEIVPRDMRFEIGQRSWPAPDDGRGLLEVATPTPGELERLARSVAVAAPESLAVCLLHSYADPEIERRVAEALASVGVPTTCSASVLREYREYERFSTAVVNAALVPLMQTYLAELGRHIGDARLSLLQSNGGTLPASRAAVEPVRVLFSGPAGGVVGAARAAKESGFDRIVGLDMGGTSTDVAFCDAREASPVAMEPTRVAGYPIAVPSLDIHTIGCGGGSLVTVDTGGVLHVGPESAGADPGPVCYGRGGQLAVTDAHVLLGHIASGPFLEGSLELDRAAVRRAFEPLAKKLGSSPERVAAGVLDVARAAMRRAVGVMTMQRGQDPSSLLLVAFGGAGGLHAAAVADSLDMDRALIPRWPGLLSAYGMASADAIREASRTVLAPLSKWNPRRRRAAFAELLAETTAELRAAGFASKDVAHELGLDLRYAGQSYELRISDGRAPEGSFHRRHAELYGYALEDRPVELVTLRVRSLVRHRRARRTKVRARPLPRSAILGERRAWFAKRVTARVVSRDLLGAGHRFAGPAIVEELSGTTLVPPDWRARVLGGGHLLLERS